MESAWLAEICRRDTELKTGCGRVGSAGGRPRIDSRTIRVVVRLHPEALAEYAEAVDFYENRATGLGRSSTMRSSACYGSWVRILA